ncbi:putative aarf domain-containing protein kinase, chloroplastic, partial [Nicotiana attenuata]
MTSCCELVDTGACFRCFCQRHTRINARRSDFKKEAANVESFRRYLEAMGLTKQATAPKVYPQYSTKRVLTMERLYGVPLTDLDSIKSLVSSPETSLITAM